MALFVLPFSNHSTAAIDDTWISNIEIQQLSPSLSPFPSNEITTLFKSRNGYVWIGTDHGLYRYDGYQFKTYKNTITTPRLFTSNNIRSITEDANGNLWIGTTHGLNFLDVHTGNIRQYHFTDYSNCDYVGQLLITSKGQLWVGTEGGIYIYNNVEDAFKFYCDQVGNSRVPHCAIKWLCEDSKGYIWVGTWDRGLFRYNPNKTWYEMPKFNDANSAHTIISDKYGKLWVGTWGKGLYRIDNPYDTGKPLAFHNYMENTTSGNLLSNYISSLILPNDNGQMWISTRKGLTLCSFDEKEATLTAFPQEKEPYAGFFKYGVNTIVDAGNGNLILSANYRGMAFAHYEQNKIVQNSIEQHLDEGNSIHCVYYDSHNRLWIGLEKHGVMLYDSEHHTLQKSQDFPLTDKYYSAGDINSFAETRKGDMIVCTTRGGMIVTPSDHTLSPYILNRDNSPWLLNNCIYSVVEDKEGNLLIGTWTGLSVRYTNGKGCHIDTDSLLSSLHITYIMIAKDESIWMTTSDGGILRAKGNVHNPKSIKVTAYSQPLNSELPINDAVRILQDKQGRIWACSLDMGLMQYDTQQDGFVCVNQKYSIPDDAIYSMEESPDGALWLSSRLKLARLVVGKDGNVQSICFYTNISSFDILHFNQRGASTSSRNGTLCFASLGGFTTLNSRDFKEDKGSTPCVITDIKIFNQSLEQFADKERDHISNTLPPYTDNITLDPSHNDINIEFSSLNYINPNECRFAYILEGYDKEWIFTEPGKHSAYYSNLPPGMYNFRVRAADSDGGWSKEDKVLTIVVLPPLWLRWWALLIYLAVIVMAIVFIYRYSKQRTIHQQQLRLAQMENDKIEELNHKKLQFFTNVTHDLMTPLTVISATISKLEQESAEQQPAFQVIQSNLQRLMRLLQQILEFRKVETGHVSLRVSQGDICQFCRSEVESIQPLIQNKKLHISLVCTPESLHGYFDTDALDKILYNLLSNAAKYNKPFGYVQMTVTAEGDFVTIAIKDNGQGIPKSKQATIFTRFYEGDHRKFNTYGTGIGLSLTHDLVQLHHGEIRFESEEGKGTSFFVTLPIAKSYYKDEEIEETILSANGIIEDETAYDSLKEKGIVQEEEENAETSKQQTILIVEDNDDLLSLMKSLLSRQYNVHTAYNGNEGLEILESKDKIDLIVCDIMMPVMDGVEMLRHIRKNPDYSNIPVIMLTAKRNDMDRAEAYEAGADAYMTKPFNPSVLSARISNLLERTQKQKNELKKRDLVEMADITITDEDEEFLKTCIHCVQKHISDADYNQQQFADDVGTSKSTLYKRLKALTGFNVSAFMRNIRMKTAIEILNKNPNIRISELAYSVGYNDPKYFSSCFKKDFGMLPSEYVSNMGSSE